MSTKPYKDFDTVLRIYYGYTELTNAQICELFEVSRSTAKRYKNEALTMQYERGHKTMQPNAVNTKDAFDAWGIDVADIEKRREKLKKLGIVV